MRPTTVRGTAEYTLKYGRRHSPFKHGIFFEPFKHGISTTRVGPVVVVSRDGSGTVLDQGP